KRTFESDDALAGEHANAQFFAVEGLGDKVVGASLDAAHDVGLVGSAGKKDDVYVVRDRGGTDALDEFDTREARHFPIGDDDVEGAGAERLPGGLPVFSGGHRVAPGLELPHERCAGDAIILGDENP